MKKLLAATLVIGMLISGCASQKDDATTFATNNTDKYIIIKNNIREEVYNSTKKFRGEQFFAYLSDESKKYAAQLAPLLEKTTKAKVQKDNDKLKKLAINMMQTEIDYYEHMSKYKGVADKVKFFSELDELHVAREEAYLIYANELYTIIHNKPIYNINLKYYKMLNTGMSYTDVINTLGAPGTLVKTLETSILGVKRQYKHYKWENGPAVINIKFDNNKAVQIEQEGLK